MRGERNAEGVGQGALQLLMASRGWAAVRSTGVARVWRGRFMEPPDQGVRIQGVSLAGCNDFTRT